LAGSAPGGVWDCLFFFLFFWLGVVWLLLFCFGVPRVVPTSADGGVVVVVAVGVAVGVVVAVAVGVVVAVAVGVAVAVAVGVAVAVAVGVAVDGVPGEPGVAAFLFFFCFFFDSPGVPAGFPSGLDLGVALALGFC